METFSHSGGRDEVLELKCNLGSFLRQSAFFEGIGKLIVLADSQQKLRLRQQGLDLHSALLGCRGQGGEIHVRGDVLFSRRFVRIRTLRVLAIGSDRAAMPPASCSCRVYP